MQREACWSPPQESWRPASALRIPERGVLTFDWCYNPSLDGPQFCSGLHSWFSLLATVFASLLHSYTPLPACQEVIFQCQTASHLPAFLLTTSFYLPQWGWRENRSCSFKKKERERGKLKVLQMFLISNFLFFIPLVENPTVFPSYSSHSFLFLKYGIETEHNNKQLAPLNSQGSYPLHSCAEN